MDCKTHSGHDHKHGQTCGHRAIEHEGHTDYVHDGHLHHMHGDHIDEHKIADSGSNKSSCTPEHACGSHDNSHKHRQGCGHDAIPHGDHTDFLVSGHLHHPCGSHCDQHGMVRIA